MIFFLVHKTYLDSTPKTGRNQGLKNRLSYLPWRHFLWCGKFQLESHFLRNIFISIFPKITIYKYGINACLFTIFTMCFLWTVFMWIARSLKTYNLFSHILHLKIIYKDRMVFLNLLRIFKAKYIWWSSHSGKIQVILKLLVVLCDSWVASGLGLCLHIFTSVIFWCILVVSSEFSKLVCTSLPLSIA